MDDEQREALLDEAIAAFRSILIRRPDLVRVRLELGLAFYLKQQDNLAREHFERALVGKAAGGPGRQRHRLLKVIRARKRWDAWFGFSIAPDTNINAASDAEFIYINKGLPFRRGAGGPGQYRYRPRGLGGAVNTNIRWPNAGALRSGLNVNHREYKGSRWDQTFLAGYAGPRWLITRDTEMSLLATASQRWWGRLQLELRLRRAPGSGAPGLRGPAAERPGPVERPQIPAAEVPGRTAHGVFPGRVRYVLFPTVQVHALVGYQQQDAVARRLGAVPGTGRARARTWPCRGALPWA